MLLFTVDRPLAHRMNREWMELQKTLFPVGNTPNTDAVWAAGPHYTMYAKLLAADQPEQQGVFQLKSVTSSFVRF